MNRYRIEVKRSAAKEIASIGSSSDRRRVLEAIESLAEDPRPRGCRKLSGAETYRLRVGAYRIVYTVEDAVLVVQVVRVGHRREVNRR